MPTAFSFNTRDGPWRIYQCQSMSRSEIPIKEKITSLLPSRSYSLKARLFKSKSEKKNILRNRNSALGEPALMIRRFVQKNSDVIFEQIHAELNDYFNNVPCKPKALLTLYPFYKYVVYLETYNFLVLGLLNYSKTVEENYYKTIPLEPFSKSRHAKGLAIGGKLSDSLALSSHSRGIQSACKFNRKIRGLISRIFFQPISTKKYFNPSYDGIQNEPEN